MIRQHGKIRLLIDGSGFNGWENVPAFEAHAGFVRPHQHKVQRIAVVTGHDWQSWLGISSDAALEYLNWISTNNELLLLEGARKSLRIFLHQDLSKRSVIAFEDDNLVVAPSA